VALVPRGTPRPFTLTMTLALTFALALPVRHAFAAAHAGVGPGTPARAAGSCPAAVGAPLPLPLHALDVALLGPDRLVVLGAEEVALFALDQGHVALLSRKPLAGPFEVVRVPGGILQASERDAAVWAMTSRSGRAVLFAVEGTELVERQQADALPFPGCPGGFRYRPGTNLLEGEVEKLEAGPYLDVVVAEPVLAVSPEGRLLAAGLADTGSRVGPTLAAVWPGLFAASLPVPPGEADAVVLQALSAATAVASCAVPAPVRAIAARAQGETARFAVAMDEAEGRSSLLVFDLPRPAR
jgi:hypothetical protein